MPLEWPKGKRPVFVGAGWTMIRRYMPRTKASNAKEAATMAIADAGLKISDIDGIFIWANPNWGVGGEGPSVWLDVNQMMQVMPWENIKFWLQPEAVGAGSCTGSGACPSSRWQPGRKRRHRRERAPPGKACWKMRCCGLS